VGFSKRELSTKNLHRKFHEYASFEHFNAYYTSPSNTATMTSRITKAEKRKLSSVIQRKNSLSVKEPAAKVYAAAHQESAEESDNSSVVESEDNESSNGDANSVQNEGDKPNDADDMRNGVRQKRVRNELSTPPSKKMMSPSLKKKLSDDNKARVVFEAVSGSNDPVDFYVWKKNYWKNGEYVPSTPSLTPPKQKKASISPQSKKTRWTKTGHKVAKKIIADYGKKAEASIQRALTEKFRKKKPDEVRQITEEGIEFLEKVAYHTTPDFTRPIEDADVHKIIANPVMKEFWTSNVKAAKVNTAMELRNEIERDFAEISAEYAAKEASYADKIDLINWRLARKAQSLEQNVMARRILAYLNSHADPELESDVGDEIPDSTEVLTDLGSGVESD